MAVNAMGSPFIARMQCSASAGIDDNAIAAVSAAVDRRTRTTIQRRDHLADAFAPPFTFVEVNMANIREEDVRERFQAVETSLDLPRAQVSALIRWGGRLLGENVASQSFPRRWQPGGSSETAPRPAVSEAPTVQSSSAADGGGRPAPQVRRSAPR